jgi:hypothetical protein
MTKRNTRGTDYPYQYDVRRNTALSLCYCALWPAAELSVEKGRDKLMRRVLKRNVSSRCQAERSG